MASLGILNLFDNYSRQARLYPTLLLIFPAIIAATALTPELLTSKVAMILISIGVTCGLLYLMANTVRSLGKRVEPSLLAKWNGWPTTEVLRHTGPLDVHTRARYHKFLEESLPGYKLPTAAEEHLNPSDADSLYNSAVVWLKEQARGSGFPLVEKENAQYGFRRNLLGARGLGIAICILCTLLSALIFIWQASRFQGTPFDIWAACANFAPSKPWLSASIACSFLGAGIWTFGVNERWVREAGRQYARSLLAVCDRPKSVA